MIPLHFYRDKNVIFHTFINECFVFRNKQSIFAKKTIPVLMYRTKIEDLIVWKRNPRRKPLIMRGARQVGKTWLLQEFGRKYYSNCVYVNFESATELSTLFNIDFDVRRIIRSLQIYSNKIIDENTLIILDEIQAVKGGLTSLKYFYENAPQYNVVAAGSLLGIQLHENDSFPVGKVNFIDLYPMSFDEFLLAIGEKSLQSSMANQDWETVSIFHNKLVDYLRIYFYVGGMPEVVNVYCQTHDFAQVREVQKEIIRDYEADFSKHVPTWIVSRLYQVWQSIPSQLAKENKKFVYGVIREGARAKDFEIAIQWLIDCGLLIPCRRVKVPRLPLVAYQEISVFKLFLVDVGLLSAMTGLNSNILLDSNNIFTEFKGALTEQYVMQQLNAASLEYVGYWTNNRSTSEVDFIVQWQGKVIPIEAKAEENVRAKSFKLFCQTYTPQLAIRTSMRPYKQETWMTNVPLYGIAHFANQS